VKVLHVVTLQSADNSFGGPVRVALNLASALQRNGHEVVLVSLGSGVPVGRVEIEGVAAVVFQQHTLTKSLGFSGIYNLNFYRYILSHVAEYDLVHVHLARDLVTAPAAFIAMLRKVPLVIQTHGMVDESRKYLARLLDYTIIRKVLRKANCVLTLTDIEKNSIDVLSRKQAVTIYLPNGVPNFSVESFERNGICFYARLAPIKRPIFFLEIADALLKQNIITSAVMSGPDEGELGLVLEKLEMRCDNSIEYVGASTH